MNRLYTRLLSIFQHSFFLRHTTPNPLVDSRRIYLDNAGATEMGEKAKHAFLEASHVYGNPSAIHKEGSFAGVYLDKARALVATPLNVHAYEIYFTSSGTESCNLAILGTYGAFVRERPATIPHIIVSSVEHPAILEPVRFLEKEKKIRVTYLPVYESGIVSVSDVANALSDDTILISIMYANNEIGTVQPIKEIGRMLDEWKREQGLSHISYPYFHTDACQAANYSNLDALRLKVTMMTVNSSKVYGPKGVAALYKREGVKISPISYGGGQERELRSGTENVAGAYAFGVALCEAHALREQESIRLREIRDATVASLTREIPSIVFYGEFDHYRPYRDQGTTLEHIVLHTEKRLPNNINCRVPGISSEEMILRLDAKGFAVSHKSACASLETDGSYVLTALGATEKEARENIRISMGRATTKHDMDALVLAMKDIATKYSA